ncbi:MAG: hypothetical protein DCF15_17925 [Phormidesmis priestleyi]|uniref:Uncharacterized protein n=1 Tax=Phormidesmis priestleyi TaxID=268141 RepID=A0A2W4WV82_9CYAN|nr:MAG: hypothetical protein DCF15_17925 [Phormidesmis priestleyi]
MTPATIAIPTELNHNAVTLLERSLMMTEQSDRRILAAIRCVDSITRRPISAPLQLSASGSRFIRNRSGDYILLTAPGFESYSHTFRLETLAAAPPPTTLDITLSDPSGYYLPRKFSLALPRPADPTADDALFKTLTVPLYPSPLASKNPGWAILRTSIVNATRQPLPWTLIEITPEVAQPGQSATILAQADWRGEALVIVPGIPVSTWATATDADADADAPVTTQNINIQLNLLFDASQITPLPADTDFSNNPNRDYVPNPDTLLANRAALLTSSHTLAVAAGSDRALTLTFT